MHFCLSSIFNIRWFRRRMYLHLSPLFSLLSRRVVFWAHPGGEREREKKWEKLSLSLESSAFVQMITHWSRWPLACTDFSFSPSHLDISLLQICFMCPDDVCSTCGLVALPAIFSYCSHVWSSCKRRGHGEKPASVLATGLLFENVFQYFMPAKSPIFIVRFSRLANSFIQLPVGNLSPYF